MKKYLTYLPSFFLPLGCIGITSGFQLMALIIALLNYFKFNIRYNIKEFLNNKYIRRSFVLMCLWAFSISLSDFLFSGDISGAKEGWNYFQRFFPFLIIGIVFFNNKQFFKYFVYGLLLATVIININVFYNLYLQGHWRPSTMFGNPNKLGGFLILILPFVISSIFYMERYISKFFVIFLSCITLVSLLISGSRGALVGLFISFFILFILIFIKKINSRQIIKFVIISIFCCFLITYIVYQYFPYMIIRGYDMERVYLWQAAIQMFKDNMILGVGAGNFNYNYVNSYMNPMATNTHLTSPHNIFLHYLSQRGLLVGVPFIILFIYQLHVLLKNLFIGENINYFVAAGFISVLGMGIHGLFDTQITMRDYALMYWLLYGFSCCNILSCNKGKKE